MSEPRSLGSTARAALPALPYIWPSHPLCAASLRSAFPRGRTSPPPPASPNVIGRSPSLANPLIGEGRSPSYPLGDIGRTRAFGPEEIPPPPLPCARGLARSAPMPPPSPAKWHMSARKVSDG